MWDMGIREKSRKIHGDKPEHMDIWRSSQQKRGRQNAWMNSDPPKTSEEKRMQGLTVVPPTEVGKIQGSTDVTEVNKNHAGLLIKLHQSPRALWLLEF